MRSFADEAFLRWSVKRHVWLWRMHERSRSRFLREATLRGYCALLRLDRAAWVTFNGY